MERLEWLRKRTGAPLMPFQSTGLCAERTRGNIENLIGGVEVPVGLAGPLLINGVLARGLFYAPLATTEGALVSSVVRGALALSRSGGVTVRVLKQRMLRAPVFVLADLDQALRLCSWIPSMLAELRREVGRISRHAHLVSVEPVVSGRAVYTRFFYETGEAAGQNMTTSCTWRACQWLLEQAPATLGFPVAEFMIESNMAGDKNVTASSMLSGRGLRVAASGLVRGSVLRRVLDVTAEKMARMHRIALMGGMQGGVLGSSVNAANVIAAMFAATGQDIACVHEASLALLELEAQGDDLFMSILLPSLPIGTVGGGTHLPGQRALLEMLGCEGLGGTARLGEIIGAFCLALELSTCAAVVSGAFVGAHDRMGRSRPRLTFTRAEVTPGFFEPALRRELAAPELAVRGLRWLGGPVETAILSSLPARDEERLVGVHRLELDLERRPGATPEALRLLLKAKPLDEELLHAMSRMAHASGRAVASAWSAHARSTIFAGTHVRELGVYGEAEPRLRAAMPRVVDIVRDDARELYALVLEDLAGAAVIDAIDDLSAWTRPRITTVLRGLGDVHAIWLDREDELTGRPWLGVTPSAERVVGMSDLWVALAEHIAGQHPDLVDAAALKDALALVASLPAWWPAFEAMPRTLVHNDCNPRNLALRDDGRGALELKLFDWELATLHVPQVDLAELLAHVLPPDVDGETVEALSDVHRTALERASGRLLPRAAWREGLRLALRDFSLQRLGFLGVGHTYRSYGYLPRVFRTTRRLRHLLGD